jgi:hypothetical protein
VTAETIWWLAGLGALAIGLYVLLLIFASRRDRWPR